MSERSFPRNWTWTDRQPVPAKVERTRRLPAAPALGEGALLGELYESVYETATDFSASASAARIT
jgi:hypothetical protein